MSEKEVKKDAQKEAEVKKEIIEEKVDLHGFKYWTSKPADK